ncbi:hypothetical protein IAU59_001207 [Kwoniella sp. CBS 9459]
MRSSQYPSSSAPASAIVPDYYAVLGLSHDATDDEITKAWRKLVLLHHPDKQPTSSSSSSPSCATPITPDTDSMTASTNEYDLFSQAGRAPATSEVDIRLINEARSVLSDPSKRETWRQLFLSSPNGNASASLHPGTDGKTPIPKTDGGPHVFRNVSLDEFEPHYTPYTSERGSKERQGRNSEDSSHDKSSSTTHQDYLAGDSPDEAREGEYMHQSGIDNEEHPDPDAERHVDGDVDPLWWSYPCRCSSTFVITLEQLEEGVEVIGCEGCGEWIRVGYQAVDEDGGDGV